MNRLVYLLRLLRNLFFFTLAFCLIIQTFLTKQTIGAEIAPQSMVITGSFDLGDNITFTVNATNQGTSSLYYKFFYCANYGTPDYDSSPWVVMQEYSTINSCSYAFHQNGSFVVVARVVSDPNNEPADLPIIGGVVTIGSSGIHFTSLSSGATGVVNPGTPVTYTANASTLGGTLYYKWFYRSSYGTPDYDSSPWIVVKDYSTDNSCNYTFPGGGEYIIVVRAVTDPNDEPSDLPIFGAVVNCSTSDQTSMRGKIPDTGQTTSYTNTFGEDSDYTINPPSYTKLDVSGNALPDSATEWVMIKDNVTELIWENKTNDGSINDGWNRYTWYDAQRVFIAQLNEQRFGGYSDWRLPTIFELCTIVHTDKDDPAINLAYFKNTLSSNYWSSTSRGANTNSTSAWEVLFEHGHTYYLDKTISLLVRAVRGELPSMFADSSNPGRMLDNNNGTVTDSKTGLMWQQGELEIMNWENALTYCENLRLAGYDDWRLPNRNELQSLVDYSKEYRAIDTTVFPDITGLHINSTLLPYWTSTTSYYALAKVWLVYFYYGKLSYNDSYNAKTAKNYVRAVRGGQ